MIDNDFRLLDPKVMDDRTSYESEVTSRRANFIHTGCGQS